MSDTCALTTDIFAIIVDILVTNSDQLRAMGAINSLARSCHALANLIRGRSIADAFARVYVPGGTGLCIEKHVLPNGIQHGITRFYERDQHIGIQSLRILYDRGQPTDWITYHIDRDGGFVRHVYGRVGSNVEVTTDNDPWSYNSLATRFGFRAYYHVDNDIVSERVSVDGLRGFCVDGIMNMRMICEWASRQNTKKCPANTRPIISCWWKEDIIEHAPGMEDLISEEDM